MNIRKKLTFRFATIVALLMLLSFVAIYIISAAFRKQNFYDRLDRKANITAKFLIDVDEISSDLLLKIERDNPTSLPYEKIRVYDYRDSLIFSTDKSNTIKVDKMLIDKVRLNGEVVYTQDDYEVLGFLFSGKLDRFVVIAAAKDVNGFSRLKDLRAILIITFLINVLLITLAGWVYAGRALKPISKVIDQVEKITASNLNLRVDEGKSQDEIAALAKTFNSMLDRIESAFKIQKNFIANASHELRTPLTSITGQLEIMLIKANTEEEYRRKIESVLEDMRNLNHISNQLLLLAQTTDNPVQPVLTNLRVDELVWEARADLLKLKTNYVVNVSINEGIEDDEQLVVVGNEYLLKTAMLNLMDNGCKYSADHTVTVEIKSRDNQLTINFIDRGIGIDNAELQYIFEPFFRAKNTIGKKGHGIGLSLVNKIIKLQNGTIQVESKVHQGSTFTLLLPSLK